MSQLDNCPVLQVECLWIDWRVIPIQSGGHEIKVVLFIFANVATRWFVVWLPGGMSGNEMLGDCVQYVWSRIQKKNVRCNWAWKKIAKFTPGSVRFVNVCKLGSRVDCPEKQRLRFIPLHLVSRCVLTERIYSVHRMVCVCMSHLAGVDRCCHCLGEPLKNEHQVDLSACGKIHPSFLQRTLPNVSVKQFPQKVRSPEKCRVWNMGEFWLRCEETGWT